MAVAQRRSAPASEQRMEHWEPAQDFEQVVDTMRKFLDETLGGSGLLPEDAAKWIPLVDVEETDDAYLVEADVPGVKRDDVNIELVGDELTISGEIKERERVGVLRRKTRRKGFFEFRVRLPNQVDRDNIEARLDDGVLTVRVPKAQPAERRKIEVKK